MKLCKDCKHNRPHFLFGQEFAKCAAVINHADGRLLGFSGNQRLPIFDSINECGSTGKLWERRKPLIERFMKWVRA